MNKKKDQIVAARMKMLDEIPFFGALASRLKIKELENSSIGKIGVTADGTLLVGDIQTMSQNELAFTLAHEVCHLIFSHHQLTRNYPALATFSDTGEQYPLIYIAADYYINLLIEDYIRTTNSSFLKMPEDILYDEKYRNMATIEIYMDLLKNTPKYESSISQDVVPGDDDSDSPDQDKENLTDNWQGKAVQAKNFELTSRGLGSLGIELDSFFKTLVPVIPWEKLLAQWVGMNFNNFDYSHRRPSKRQFGQALLSIMDKQEAPKIVVLWDTSGSMDGQEQAILSEVDAIAKALQSEIRVIVCDSKVHGDYQDISSAIDMMEKVKGGGGSDFRPAFELVEDTEDKDSVIIAFTDGEIDVPKNQPAQPVLFVLTSKQSEMPWGDKILLPKAN